MELKSDIISRLFGHRLKQADIKRILGTLSDADRDEFVEKISEVLGKVTALLEVANRVSDTLSLDILLKRMMEITTEVTNADRSTLFLNDPETGELFARVALGDLTEEIRFPNHVGIAGGVFTSGKAVLIPDAYVDPRFNQEIDKKTGYRTRNILCVPIRTKEAKLVGVTQILNKKNGDFTGEDLSMLEAITAQAASALLNAQLHEQVVRAREEEAMLLNVTTALSSELRLGPLLAMIMDTTKDLLAADRCTLFMHDSKRNELWSQVAQGLGGEFKEIRFPSHLGIAGTVFTTGETINISDAYADGRFNPEVDRRTGYRTRSILCQPVRNKNGSIIGVTQVLNKRGGPFTATDERRLQAFSSQASVAIENAQLFDEILTMKNYNESMLESMSNGVISLNAERTMVKCNSSAGRIFQKAAAELAGHPAEVFFQGENEWVLERIDTVMDTRKPEVSMDADLSLRNGNSVSVNLTVVPLIDFKDELIGSLLVLEDITSEKRVKSTMARYMTRELADKLLAGGEDALGGQTQRATILFSDIRRFTTLSEQMGPQETVSMLNDYFSIMVDVIFRYGGILDKYIGDAIMAVFGAPFSTGEDADRAVLAAVDMMVALRDFNRERIRAGKVPLEIGVGISTDEILSGNIGSEKRMDYTVIGDGVNLASRLEGANKFYGTNILASEYTIREIQQKCLCREVDLIRVKGKIRPVGVYEIMGHHSETTFPRLSEFLDLYRQGLTCYHCRDWQGGVNFFQMALDLNNRDQICRLYKDRCRQFLTSPPDDDWDGVCVMETK